MKIPDPFDSPNALALFGWFIFLVIGFLGLIITLIMLGIIVAILEALL